jgi:hypothetical protein
MSPAGPRPCRSRAAAPAAALASALAACTPADPDPPDAPGGSETGDTTGPTIAAPAPTDACEDAPLLTYGRHRGTLRSYELAPAPAGVCRGGGPDAFARVGATVRADLHIEARGVGFVPRLSLAPDDCAPAREIACADGSALELRDLTVGTVVRVSVGADPDVFSDLNLQSAPNGAPDPLEYDLDIAFTRVLAAGEACLPASRGRCADGTMCLASAEGSAHVCTTLPGDTCATAEHFTVVLDADGLASATVDVAAPHTDAHRGSCSGAGRREHVLRLGLPPSPPERALEVHATRDDTGLAARAPGCLADEEVACAAPTAGGARIVIPRLATLRAAGVEPYLFVELPEPDAPGPPLVLEFSLVPEPPIWGDL